MSDLLFGRRQIGAAVKSKANYKKSARRSDRSRVTPPRIASMRSCTTATRCTPQIPRSGALEDIVAAFEYGEGGVRTKTTPREACGPELKALLKTRAFSAVRLRTMPAHEEDWFPRPKRRKAPLSCTVEARNKFCSPAASIVRFCAEGANGWISFAGEMAHAYGTLAHKSLRRKRSTWKSNAINHQNILRPTSSNVCRGPKAGAQIFACDAWQVVKGAA